MADFLNPYDAYMGGKSQSQTMAKERAERIIQEIIARKKEEMLNSDLASQDVDRRIKEAELAGIPERNRIEQMKAKAYADQVAAQAEAARRAKPYDEARAADLQAQNSYGPLNAIMGMAGTDIGGAAQSYDKLKESLPPNVRAVLERQQPSNFAGPNGQSYESTFNPDGLAKLLESFRRPKEVAGLEKQGMVGQQSETRNIRDNETKITVAQIQAAAKQATADIAANKYTPMDYERHVVSLVRSGKLTEEEGRMLVLEVKQAAANAAAAQDKPTINLEDLGVPTVTPRERRGQGSPQLNLPQGWTIE